MTPDTLIRLEIAMEIVAPLVVAVAIAWIADVFVLRPLLAASWRE